MPEPRDGESQEDFMSRCIPAVIDEGREQPQAVAMCASYWDAEDKAAKFASVTYNGVTVQATGKRSSSRAGKKWERTVRRGDTERVVAWGDPDMTVRAGNPEARANFNSRHNCAAKKDPFSPGFWACWDWNVKGGGMEDELEVKAYGSYTDDEAMAYVPMGVKTFAEFDAMEKAGTCQRKMGGVMDQYKAMCDNIMGDPELDATGRVGAMEALTKEMLYRMKMATEDVPMMEEKDAEPEPSPGFIRRVAQALGLARKEQEPVPEPGFTVFKDANGALRWLAVYSNKYRDNDIPPEIIADAAHRDFVKAVDAGEWPYPELLLWHTPGTRTGQADFVAYDDRGFILASGTFDKGKEYVAKALLEQPDLRVSHGMPVSEIARDPRDPTVIVRYRSAEVSPLPASKAANDLTGFVVMKEGGANMALPKQKREWLAAVMGDSAVSELEAGITDKAQAAEDAGLEFKEREPEPVAPEEEPVEEVVETVAEAKDEEQPVVAPGVTREEIAETFDAFGEALLAKIDERLAPLEAAVKKLRISDDEKIKERAAGIPGASLRDLVLGRAVGAPEAKIDGRSSLAKDGPEEAATDESNWIVDKLRRGQEWRGALNTQTE